MSTATIPNEVKKTYERTASEERANNIKINGDKPLVEVKGTNTFPIKGLLSVFGGKWNKDTKTWWVPDHKWHDAQTAADEQTAKQAARDAAKNAKPVQQEAPKQEAPKQEAPKQEAPKQEAPKQAAPVITPAPVQQAAPVTATPVNNNRLVFRLQNLAAATQDLSSATNIGAVKMALALAMDALALAAQEAISAQ